MSQCRLDVLMPIQTRINVQEMCHTALLHFLMLMDQKVLCVLFFVFLVFYDISSDRSAGCKANIIVVPQQLGL